MSKPTAQSLFGRYREIIIAVGFFLVFDLGVLALNFYTSFRISEDAAAINIAGRQRMLSQRISKLSYALDTPQHVGNEPDLMELAAASALFDRSLKAFQVGGVTPGGDGVDVALAAASSDSARKALSDAQPIWTRLRAAIDVALKKGATVDDYRGLATLVRSDNLKLLASMNGLTTALEAEAAQRASFLRLVQTIGIVLALLNFAYILFKFLRRLRSTDAAIEQVSAENAQILSSVREGLFLINTDRSIGSQLSKSVSTLFNKEVMPGQDFFGLLESMIEPTALQEAKDYVDLLFAPHVKERLIQGINPLSSVSIHYLNRLDQRVTSHLSFAFTRVISAGAVEYLLVTVQDVSAKVLLQDRLGLERQRAQREFSMLLTAVKSDAAQLAQFTTRGTALLGEVNDCLRKLGEGGSRVRASDLLTTAHRALHRFKGDASSLGLELLATLAHELESQLREIERAERATPGAAGASLIGVPVLLDDLMTKLEVVSSLAKSLHSQARTGGAVEAAGAVEGAAALEPLDMLAQQEATAMQTLVGAVANDLAKSAQLSIDLPGLARLSEAQRRVIHDVSVQLLRNAVVHGIEDPATRRANGKTAQGHISLSLVAVGQKATLTIKDDGGGMVQARLRARLAQLNWFDAEKIVAMTDQEVMAQMFRPGFSTAVATPSEGIHAGRGVGLDVVQALAKSIGAKVGISNAPGRYAEFRLTFALEGTA